VASEGTDEDRMSSKMAALRADLLHLSQLKGADSASTDLAKPVAHSTASNKALDVVEPCVFQANIDYQDPGLDIPVKTGLTQKECCASCRNTPQCKVAVLSAAYDDPPNACWLKTSISQPVKKDGVMACKPYEKSDGAIAKRDVFGNMHQTADQVLAKTAPQAAATDVLVPAAATGGATTGGGTDDWAQNRAQGGVDNATTQKRREAVVKMMEHAWGSYKQGAWGYNEVDPQSGRHRCVCVCVCVCGCVCVCVCVGGCVGGWVGRWVGGWVGGSVGRWVGGCVFGCVDVCVCVCVMYMCVGQYCICIG
jgi:hypothetical protein